MKTDKVQKYDARVRVSKRQKKRNKCKKAAITAMALTQHECMPGECKVNEHA